MQGPIPILIMLLFAVGIFAAPGGYALFRYLQARNRAHTSAAWPAAPGRITRAQVGTQESRDSDGGLELVYIPQVTFEYQVAGMTYEGSRISYGAHTLSNRQAGAVLARYPVGAGVQVRYDPAKPADSVLEPAAPLTTGWLIAAIVFLLLALCGLCVFGSMFIRAL